MCDKVIRPDEEGVCERCTDKLETVGAEYCLKCGVPVNEQDAYCQECETKKVSYEQGRSVFLYNKAMQMSMERFKNQSRAEYGRFYAKAMYEMYGDWIKCVAPDAFIPVPIHKKRYEKRGYNQAAVVAKQLGKSCEIPVYTDFLVRKKNTLAQKQLNKQERKENLNGAFAIATERLYQKPKCVIIIDDIYTTGCTVEACAQVLFQHGIEKIYFLCVCTGGRN